jgi:hypothetical protein
MIKETIVAAAMWAGTLSLGALAEGVPKIQFEQTVYDFGKTSQVEVVSGTFKFKNTGDGLLKLMPPKPSCGCTIASLKPDSLPPGESGELAFTLNLGLAKALLEKRIAVSSNDPQTPEVSLTIKVDYTPLYELNPLTLTPNLAFGVNDTVQFTSLTRTDGKPLRILRLDGSQTWIKAAVEPNDKADDASVRIRVAVQREGSPRRFSEFVHVYAADQTNTPVSRIYLYGQIMGEVSLSPEVLYWSITDAAKTATESPEAMITRRLTIRTAKAEPFELKNPQSTIKGMKVELVAKEAGKVYELVARLDDVPAKTISGNVSFETSVGTQPRIEVPVIVNVFKPR